MYVLTVISVGSSTKTCVISWIFDLTLMGISPIAYDVALMFYFVYWEKYPTRENDDLFDILLIRQFHMFYVYDFMCWAWTLKHIINSMFCVEWEALEHMSIWCFVLSKKLWSTYVFDFLCWARRSRKHQCLILLLSERLWSTWVMKNLCWAGISQAHAKIRIGSVGHMPWIIPSSCWA